MPLRKKKEGVCNEYKKNKRSYERKKYEYLSAFQRDWDLRFSSWKDLKWKSFANNAVSKTNGTKLKIKLDSTLYKKEKISVDFEGIDQYSFPFFNRSFVLLATQYGFQAIEQIELLNISSEGKLIYKESMENAKFISELNEKQKQEVERIVKNAFDDENE